MGTSFPHPSMLMEKDSFVRAVSEPRFKTFLDAARGNRSYAAALYLYNVNLAEAFMLPLQMAEVTLRNNIDRVLNLHFGEDWTGCKRFQKMLPPHAVRALDRAVNRDDDDDRTNDPAILRNRLISSLPFEFWVELLGDRYESIWRLQFRRVFPNLSSKSPRQAAYQMAKQIKNLRNKVAHHEPIFLKPLQIQADGIYRFIQWMSEDVAAWVKASSRVSEVIGRKPSHNAGPPALKELATTDFIEAELDERLDVVLSQINENTQIVVGMDEGEPCQVITPAMLLQFVARREQLDLHSLAHVTLGDVAYALGRADFIMVAPENAPVMHVASVAVRGGVRFVIGTDEAGRPSCAAFIEAA